MSGLWSTIVALLPLAALAAQAGDSSHPEVVFTTHPRLFLRPARLRLLQREAQRASARWQQLEELVRSGTALPEPGFANALVSKVSGDKSAAARAVDWALNDGKDLRQLALVYDWLQGALTPDQDAALAARLSSALTSAKGDGVADASARALAAIALFDHVPDVPGKALDDVTRWWRETARRINNGGPGIALRDLYPLEELLHAVLDNTHADLRQDSPQYFQILPQARLLSFYPGVQRAAENDFRLAPPDAPGALDLRQAALARASGLAMTAFDPNAEDSQFLQGYLMRDRFALRDPFGAPYEFLWANPYQPGLSYAQAPLAYHDSTGRLFLRSSWGDDALWFGYDGGVARKYENGRVATVDLRTAKSFPLSSLPVCFGAERLCILRLDAPGAAYVVGLASRAAYRLEREGAKPWEAVADSGGVLEVSLPAGETTLTVSPAKR